MQKLSKKWVTGQDTGSQYKHPFSQSTKLKHRASPLMGDKKNNKKTIGFRYFFVATIPFWRSLPSKHLRVYFGFLHCNVSVDNFAVIPLRQITGLSNLQGSEDHELTSSRCTKEVLNNACSFAMWSEGEYLCLCNRKASQEVTGTIPMQPHLPSPPLLFSEESKQPEDLKPLQFSSKLFLFKDSRFCSNRWCLMSLSPVRATGRWTFSL